MAWVKTINALSKFLPVILKTVDSLLGRSLARILPLPNRRFPPVHILSILIIRPGGIGDAALVAPLVAALTDRYHSVSIDILAEKRNAGVFSLIPAVNRLFLYDKPLDLLRTLRGKHDLVIDTEQWHRLSAVVTRLTGTRFSIGFATNERSRLFTHAVPYSQDQYEAQSFLDLLLPLGIKLTFNPAQLFLTLPAKTSYEIESFLSGLTSASYVTIFPGASIHERHWGVENFSRLASRFRESGLLPVVVGGAAEKIAGDKIVAEGGINFAGRTSMADSASLIAASRLLVSSDSGMLHVAVGLGIPTVSLFGPGISAKWGPRGVNNVVINKEIPCSPCTSFGITPKCPYQARCMADISVDDVYRAATALLNKIKFSASMPTSIVG